MSGLGDGGGGGYGVGYWVRHAVASLELRLVSSTLIFSAAQREQRLAQSKMRTYLLRFGRTPDGSHVVLVSAPYASRPVNCGSLPASI